MKAKLKAAISVLAVASALFSVVYGVVFVLQPETPPPSLPEPSAALPPTRPVAVLDGKAAAGASLFARNCTHCHGGDAKGDEGPSLYDLSRTDARITTIIKEGIKGEMPRFGSKFTDEDVHSLIAYLRTLKG